MDERRLIVNADDLGLSPGVNRGIVELAAAGAVTGASLLMNLPATADALALTAGADLDIGVHLNLTVGAPLTGGAASLVGADGRFPQPERLMRRLFAGRLRLDEVEREWAAQIEAFLATGRRLAHLDSHVHLHALPGLTGVALRLARHYGVGAVRLRGHGLMLRQAVPALPAWLARRWRLPLARARPGAAVLTSDCLLVLTAQGVRTTIAGTAATLRHLPAGLTELVAHPGYVDDELCRLDPLQWPREREVRLLRDERWPALLTETNTRLTTFRAELDRLANDGTTSDEQ